MPSRGVISNFRILSVCTLLSRILGLVRDMAVAAIFGGGPVLDAFIVAFRLPNLARQLFGEGALSTAFLPIFVRDMERHGNETARQTLSAVTFTVAGILSGIVLLGEGAIWSQLSVQPEGTQLALVLEFLAVLLPYMVFICLSALLSAALHSLRQFLWPGLVPVVLNVVWIVGVFIAAQSTENDRLRALLMSASIVLAGCLQLLLPLVMLIRNGWSLTFHCQEGWSRVREVFAAVLPVVAGVGLTQVGAVFDSVLAWGLSRPDAGETALSSSLGIEPVLASGTASALYLGQRLYQFPLGVFGVALGTVLFPVLTQQAERDDMAGFRLSLRRGLQLVVAISIPASAGLYLLAQPVTLLLFQRGRFDAADAALTTTMIATYGAGVWAFIALQIINRAFYAVGDRMTPMKLGLFALLFNIAFNLTAIWWLGGVALALGGVLAVGLQLLFSLNRLTARIGQLDWQPVHRTFLKVAAATALMTLAVLGTQSLLPTSDTLTVRCVRVLAPLLSGTVVYLGASYFLRINEVWSLLRSELPDAEELGVSS
ncbi:MAG: murein biosynthesis integral membrane protein MurJ [Planctomycetaceae bacterium]|nr:murein biosynthesis integral membrane protein MurJ [Planctomycetaceae bacterium]